MNERQEFAIQAFNKLKSANLGRPGRWAAEQHCAGGSERADFTAVRTGTARKQSAAQLFSSGAEKRQARGCIGFWQNNLVLVDEDHLGASGGQSSRAVVSPSSIRRPSTRLRVTMATCGMLMANARLSRPCVLPGWLRKELHHFRSSARRGEPEQQCLFAWLSLVFTGNTGSGGERVRSGPISPSPTHSGSFSVKPLRAAARRLKQPDRT